MSSSFGTVGSTCVESGVRRADVRQNEVVVDGNSFAHRLFCTGLSDWKQTGAVQVCKCYSMLGSLPNGRDTPTKLIVPKACLQPICH